MSERMDKTTIREHNVECEMRRCKHFRGVQHKTCAAGVSFDRFRGGPGMLRLPCLSQGGTCEAAEYPTRQEAEAANDEREARIAAFLEKTNRGVCGACGDESTDWVQAGSCIYSKPCGHRVGQGDAKKYKAGVLKARLAAHPPGRTP